MRHIRTIKIMKKHILLATLASLAIMGCNQQNGSKTELDLLIAERDSLATLKSTISERLLELEASISENDTTTRLLQVTTIAAEKHAFESYFEVYGTVEAEKNAQIFPETSGLITDILVKEGQQVTAGTVLMTLDGTILQRNIEEVKTQLSLVAALFDKQERLWKQQIGSEVQYLEAKNRKESLEARLATLESQYRMTRIKAPFNGVVDQIYPKRGELAGPQAPVLRLVNLKEIHINADVSESYVGQLQKGTPVLVEIPNTGYKFESEITMVGQFIKPENRTFRIQVRVPNNDGVFKPNLLTSVKVREYATDSAVVVNNGLLLQTPDGKDYVFIVEKTGDKAIVTKVPVTAGKSYEGRTEIVSGLKGNEWIVAKGARSVKDGQRVQITE
jgi:RND family efflux transporter MFP subunit